MIEPNSIPERKLAPYNPIKSSFFDEFPDDRKEYEFEPEKLWISFNDFQKIEKEFPFFSKNPLIEGLLFKKSNETTWFHNKYFTLYQDRLVNFEIPLDNLVFCNRKI